MKRFLVGVLILIVCSTLLISEDLNSSVGVKKEDIFLRLDTGGYTSVIEDFIITKSGDIISSSNDKTIRVWDSKTGKEKRKILGQIGRETGEIYDIRLSSNMKFLSVQPFGFGRRLYDYKTGKILNTIYAHGFSNNGKILFGNNKLYDIQNNFSIFDVLPSNIKYSIKWVYNLDGKYYLFLKHFNDFALYSLDSKIIVKKIILPKKNNIQFTKNQLAIYDINQSKINLYNLSLNKIKEIILKKRKNLVYSIKYSTNGRFLLVGFHFQKEQTKYSSTIDIYDVNHNYKKVLSYPLESKDSWVLDCNNNFLIYNKNFSIYKLDLKSLKSKILVKGTYQNISNIKIEGKNITLKYPNGDIKNIDLSRMLIQYKNNILFKKVLKKYGKNFSEVSLKYKEYTIKGTRSGFLKIYNSKNKQVANLLGHVGETLALGVEGDILVSANNDQTIKIWDLSKIGKKIGEQELKEQSKRVTEKKVYRGKVNLEMTKRYISKYGLIFYPKLSLFVDKNNEWIAWTPEGYFNASEKGVDYLYFHLNHGAEHEAEAIPMKKLYDHFFRPDLIKLKLAGEEEAYQKAIGKLDFREALKNPPPTVKIDKMKKETSKDKIKFAFNVKENKGGVGLIRIYQEGKLIQTMGEGVVKRQSANIDTVIEQEKLDTKAKEKQKEYIAMLSKSIDSDIPTEKQIPHVKTSTVKNHAGKYTIEVDLKSGKNKIAIEAFNKTNTVASYRESVTIDAKIPKRKPKLYVIVAGVNKFESTAEGIKNLSYSENDANAIQKAVEEKMKTVFNGVEVTPLIGQELTKANLYKTAKEISLKAHLEDTVLFYISTHGRSMGGKLYLVPYNNANGEDWLDFEQTFQAIQSIKALNQIFVIDACESGTANDIVSAVYDSKASVLAKSSGVHMLLATTRGTNAFESDDPKVKNGVFTHRILEALRSRGTDLNQDNFISIKEVSTELRKPQSNSEFQYPVIRNVGSDVMLEQLN